MLPKAFCISFAEFFSSRILARFFSYDLYFLVTFLFWFVFFFFFPATTALSFCFLVARGISSKELILILCQLDRKIPCLGLLMRTRCRDASCCLQFCAAAFTFEAAGPPSELSQLPPDGVETVPSGVLSLTLDGSPCSTPLAPSRGSTLRFLCLLWFLHSAAGPWKPPSFFRRWYYSSNLWFRPCPWILVCFSESTPFTGLALAPALGSTHSC